MGYLQDNLVSGEQVVFETKLSWWALLNVVTIVLGVLTLGIAFVFVWLQRKSSEFAVTNKRVMIKLGMISRRTLELNLAKIESITVNQGIFGRIFDYGEICVIGTGGTKEPFKGIEHPMQFRKAVQEGLDQSHSSATAA